MSGQEFDLAAADSSEQVARIDHAVIYCEYALDRAADRYRRLGFRLTPRGHHSMGSSNHLIVFETDYVELLGVEPQNIARFGSGWDHPTGLSGLVFKTADAPELWNRLTAAGVPLEGEGPAVFYRPVELDDGVRHDAHFRLVRLALDRIPNGRVFFCEQQSPELVWRPEWQQHANGACGILEYVYMTENPGPLAAFINSAIGPGQVTAIEGGAQIRTGGAAIVFLSPAEITRRYGVNAEALHMPGGRAVALTLATHSLQSARAALAAGEIGDVREINGRIVAPPEAAAGTILCFAEQG